MNELPPKLTFPCDFPLKVIGEDSESFESFATEIVLRHVPNLLRENISSQTSRHGKYRSVSYQFVAQSREQVDALYRELSSDPRVKMVL